MKHTSQGAKTGVLSPECSSVCRACVLALNKSASSFCPAEESQTPPAKIYLAASIAGPALALQGRWDHSLIGTRSHLQACPGSHAVEKHTVHTATLAPLTLGGRQGPLWPSKSCFQPGAPTTHHHYPRIPYIAVNISDGQTQISANVGLHAESFSCHSKTTTSGCLKLAPSVTVRCAALQKCVTLFQTRVASFSHPCSRTLPTCSAALLKENTQFVFGGGGYCIL